MWSFGFCSASNFGRWGREKWEDRWILARGSVIVRCMGESGSGRFKRRRFTGMTNRGDVRELVSSGRHQVPECLASVTLPRSVESTKVGVISHYPFSHLFFKVTEGVNRVLGSVSLV